MKKYGAYEVEKREAPIIYAGKFRDRNYFIFEKYETGFLDLVEFDSVFQPTNRRLDIPTIEAGDRSKILDFARVDSTLHLLMNFDHGRGNRSIYRFNINLINLKLSFDSIYSGVEKPEYFNHGFDKNSESKRFIRLANVTNRPADKVILLDSIFNVEGLETVNSVETPSAEEGVKDYNFYFNKLFHSVRVSNNEIALDNSIESRVIPLDLGNLDVMDVRFRREANSLIITSIWGPASLTTSGFFFARIDLMTLEMESFNKHLFDINFIENYIETLGFRKSRFSDYRKKLAIYGSEIYYFQILPDSSSYLIIEEASVLESRNFIIFKLKPSGELDWSMPVKGPNRSRLALTPYSSFHSHFNQMAISAYQCLPESIILLYNGNAEEMDPSNEFYRNGNKISKNETISLMEFSTTGDYYRQILWDIKDTDSWILWENMTWKLDDDNFLIFTTHKRDDKLQQFVRVSRN